MIGILPRTHVCHAVEIGHSLEGWVFGCAVCSEVAYYVPHSFEDCNDPGCWGLAYEREQAAK